MNSPVPHAARARRRACAPCAAPRRSSRAPLTPPCSTSWSAAARKAARTLKRDFGEVENLQVSLKGPANFVSAADHRAEEILRAELAKARPGYGFLGEEGGRREGTDKTHTWIVDPLDGTTNFLHGIPQFAISIALEREGTIVAGVIYNPANDELFIAERGKGAFLNDQRLRVAARKRLAEAVVGLRPAASRARRPRAVPRESPPCRKGRRPAAVRRRRARPRLGGGRALDAYWERKLSAWDIAAGHHPGARGRRLRDRSRGRRGRLRPSARSSPATRPCSAALALIRQANRPYRTVAAAPSTTSGNAAASGFLSPRLCHIYVSVSAVRAQCPTAPRAVKMRLRPDYRMSRRSGHRFADKDMRELEP